MSKPPRDLIPSLQQVYFLSIGCSQGKSIFQSERMALLLLETLSGYRAQGKFQLHEFVVMPNHVHLLATPGTDVALERAVQFIKGGFSFRAGRELGFRGEIWQRGYVDHRIRDFADYVGAFDRSMQHHLRNDLFKDGVYDPRETSKTFFHAEDRHLEPLEGRADTP